MHADTLAALSVGTWRFVLPGRKDLGKQLLWDEFAQPSTRLTSRSRGVQHVELRLLAEPEIEPVDGPDPVKEFPIVEIAVKHTPCLKEVPVGALGLSGAVG